VPPPKLFWERKNESPFQIMNRLRRTGIPLVRRAIEQLYSDHPEIAGYTELAKPTHNINRIVSPLTEAYRWIMSLSYSLSPYLKQNVTALVPPNSLLAEQFSFWCNAAGLRIPRDMSLLSIDNQYVYLNALPITQIDTGLSRLGYLAFHLMLGDIPTAKSKNNTITAPCRIIDRATVGPARKGALKVNLEGELW